MRTLTIGIVTPGPRHARTGNRITALRWALRLRELGHRVFLEESWSGRSCDLLLALHAVRSADSVARFRRSLPRSPIVVLLTGTDLYSSSDTSAEMSRSLGAADRIVVLQPHGLADLPAQWRSKTRVIRQSARPPRIRPARAADAFEVSVVGHLRDVKDPLRAARAARLLPAGSRVRVLHVGEALDATMREAAQAEQSGNARYRWLGALRHARTTEVIASTRLLVLSSQSEGGANVISEAIAADVPVLASRIAGSIGVLGEAYPGLFEPGDERELAKLLRRCETDARYLDALSSWCARMNPLVAPERERAALADLVAELVEPPVEARAAREDGARTPRVLRLGGELELPFQRLGADVKRGLTAGGASGGTKRLSCCWFYDAEGSRLFEEICALPEYYVTRADEAILRAHASEIAASAPRGATLVELGSGSAAKTRLLIDALLERDARAPLRYVMVDISPSALEESSAALRARFPDLELVAIAAEYEDGLRELARIVRGPRLVLWLGSNIGNFHREEAAAFLARVRTLLAPEDRLLVGIDLRKRKELLERAYDDAAGVTARFNKNLLARINRELGGRFDPDAFRHRARYDETLGRIEMYLDSVREQRVRIDLLDLEIDFAAGEAVHTENSYKYSPAEILELARAAGLSLARQWFDPEHRMSENLFAPGARA